MERLRVGLFTEIYRPVVNGVVASVETLADGSARAAATRSTASRRTCRATTRPDGPVFRMPSLPLPTRTPYRLTLPLVSRRNLNTVIKRLSVVHVHSPFVTGWMGVRYARRYGMPLVYTYHTQLEAYAHYVPFEAECDALCRVATDAHVRQSRRRGGRADAGDGGPIARARRHGAHGGRAERHRRRALRAPGRATKRCARVWACVPATASLLCGRAPREREEPRTAAATRWHSPDDAALHLAVAGDGPRRGRSSRSSRASCGVGRATRFLGVVARESSARSLRQRRRVRDAQHDRDAGARAGRGPGRRSPRDRRRRAAEPRRPGRGRRRVVPATAEAFARALRAIPGGRQRWSARPRGPAAAAVFGRTLQIDRMLALYGSLITARSDCLTRTYVRIKMG